MSNSLILINGRMDMFFLSKSIILPRLIFVSDKPTLDLCYNNKRKSESSLTDDVQIFVAIQAATGV